MAGEMSISGIGSDSRPPCRLPKDDSTRPANAGQVDSDFKQGPAQIAVTKSVSNGRPRFLSSLHEFLWTVYKLSDRLSWTVYTSWGQPGRLGHTVVSPKK